jgi:glyoxylase-like metal-dependent hydrolase (beta-lactamase superfamily II)
MSGTAPTLPPQVRVFVRDWLSSNNILLNGREGHVLIDSGYGRHAPLTLALLATPQGLGAAPLARQVNTQ